MRRVSLFAFLVMLAGLLSVPSFASTDEGIVVRGGRTAYVDLYVYRAATIDPDALQLSTRGSYVGFYLSPVPANRDTVGALVMPRVAAGVMTLGQSWDVRPGRYRMFLLTDGPSQVFVPIAGQGLRGYTANRRAALSIRKVDFGVPAGSTGVTKSFPVRLRERSLVIAAGLVRSDSLTAVESVHSCVSVDSTCAATYTNISAETAATRLPTEQAWAYGASLVKPGTFSAVLDVARYGGYDAGSSVAASVMVLTIGLQS